MSTQAAQRIGRGALALLLMFGPMACGSHHASTPQANLSGKIADEAGQPISGATVTPAGGGASVTTDAQGHYAFATTATDFTALTVSATKYATISRSVPATVETADFTLRAVDLATTITLPNGAAAAQNFNVSRGGASLQVTIPADAMVTASGAIATGEAQLSMTFWNPAESMDSMPAELVAHSPFADDNDVIDTPLKTYGMFDITIEQNGQPLQVASGKTLPIVHNMAAEFAANVNQDANIGSSNYLWYLDTATQAWRLAADTTFDASTNTLTGSLPHLSSWNYDNFSNFLPPSYCTVAQIQAQTNGCGKKGTGTNLGGCVQGTIKDKSGKPISGKATLWLFSQEGIYDVTVNTDSSGHFCYNAGLRAIGGSARGGPWVQTNDLPNHTSAFRQSDNSAATNPIPNECKGMSGQWAGWNKYPSDGLAQWNNCGLVADSFSKAQPTHKPVVTPKSTTIKLCAYCPGTGPSRCPAGGVAITNQCGTVGTDGGGGGCTKILKLGESCVKATSCCDTGLICADGQCVSATDTSVSK